MNDTLGTKKFFVTYIVEKKTVIGNKKMYMKKKSIIEAETFTDVHDLIRKEHGYFASRIKIKIYEPGDEGENEGTIK